MTTLTLDSIAIRAVDGLFCLNDLHKAAGRAAKHQPTFFLRNEQTKALVAEIEASADSQRPLRIVNDGRNNGTYACRELVIAYAAWINPTFHLKVIRVFLAVTAPAPADQRAAASQPTELFRRPHFEDARRFVSDYFERWRDAAAVGELPTWNAAEFESIVDGIVANELTCGTWLLSISRDGLLNLNRMPSDARMVSPRDELSMSALIGNQVPDEMLPGMLRVGLDRLAQLATDRLVN
ncbi:KilA-N domain-containing protein [Burkholderia arboris]|uniref:KilA-N domain-containing protein n=1 Tax=Burkholderia arboris TaxID=488730 RepID=UPI001CF47C07|nr:KilA-N domain-containing protein [Burkholderia arboris]MCA8037138.1 KilA-N domain-containing protein [Burkholderia arboris]